MFRKNYSRDSQRLTFRDPRRESCFGIVSRRAAEVSSASDACLLEHKKTMNTRDDKDDNRDPISGAPGAHPVGTGVGAVGGGATGAAIGAAAGPVGAVVGAAIGAVAGGLAGKGIAEMIDPTAENAHWRDNYKNESYVNRDLNYDHYEPAYRTGYSGYGKYAGKKYDDVENDLEHDYEQAKGNSSLAWSDAKHATKAAWHKVERALPGDADGDGR